YQKCRKAAGTQANVDITINELVKAGKLRQVRFSDSESGDNPSHYDRTEWLTIYNACKDDNDDDGGAKPPSSNPDLIGKLSTARKPKAYWLVINLRLIHANLHEEKILA
ncbi:MAG: hypothetical protein ACYTF1_24975, partial [Planctomycetota bacterium]